MKIQLNSVTAATHYVAKTFPMVLKKVSGNFLGTTADRWLQVHNAKALPADTAVPVKSYPLSTGAPFAWTTDDEELALSVGCVLAISTTRDTLTISADTADWSVDGFTAIDDTGWTVAGDYTTGDSELQVWADSAGPKKLKRIEITDVGSADTYYLMLFAHDSPQSGDVPLLQKTLAAGANYDFFFGDGFVPFRLATPLTNNDGCTIGISQTSGTYTPDVDEALAIKATYV